MLKPAAKTNRGGTALAWGGGAVVLVAVLQFLKEELAAFNLDKWPLVVASAGIFFAGLAIGEIGSARARRRAHQELEDKLDGALACWPPQQASELDPYDVGVRPALRAEPGVAPYIKRNADDEIADAFWNSEVVVVFGPAGAGKSRTAFEAIPKQALMLVPEHADGLATLLRRCTSLVIKDDSAVLWLDDLDRYAEGVDVDPILAFLQKRPKVSWRHRIVGRRDPDAQPYFVRVVATIREDALNRLFDGDEPANYPVRRLMAGARGVFLPGELKGAERELFETQFGAPPGGDTVAEAFASEWHRGWSPGEALSSRPAKPWIGRQIPVVPILLIGLVAAAGAWLYAKHNELTVPAPIDQQVAALVDEATCPVQFFPADGKGIKDNARSNANVLVAVEHGGECGVSDEVRFYRQRNRRLRHVATLAPEPSATRQTFHCRGPGENPCHVVVQRRDQFIVGAFEDVQTHQERPVAISFEDRGLQVWPLALPKVPLPGVPDSIRKLDSRPAELRLQVADSDVEADGEDCLYCSTGRSAQITAVVPPRDERPALLVAGYTTAGTTDSPEKILVRMWNLKLENGRPTTDRDCVVLRNGRVQKIELEHSQSALHDGWRLEDAEVMC